MARIWRKYLMYLLASGESDMYLARTAKRSRCFDSLLRRNVERLSNGANHEKYAEHRHT